jgi:hypothetical protein
MILKTEPFLRMIQKRLAKLLASLTFMKDIF